MSESDTMEIEQGRGTEVAHFVYRVPKKNRDAMTQLNKHEETWGYTFSFPAQQHRYTNGRHYQHIQNSLSQTRRGSLVGVNIL